VFDRIRALTDSNVALNSGLNKRLSAISSIPTGWYWTYSSASSNLVSNVAYDLWLSTSSGGSNTDEIMIWLSSRGGAGPIGSQITTASVRGLVLSNGVHRQLIQDLFVGQWR
jgi:xyloglucan-specific endo-beta-1,4-glucanase